MSKRKYLSIRGLPVPKKGVFKDYTEYSKLLKNYFKSHTICDECQGKGYILSDDIYILDTSEAVNVCYKDIEELDQIKEKKDKKVGAVIKQIIEKILWGRKPCKKCHGEGFIKK